jgi:hypothetical protein
MWFRTTSTATGRSSTPVAYQPDLHSSVLHLVVESKELKNEALFIKKIRPGVIMASQVPNTMKDVKGSFYKPKEW